MPLIHQQTYAAPIQQVWQALMDTAQMRQWYFPQLQKFEPETGFRFQFTDDGSAYQKEWIVTRVETGRLLAHSWIYKGYTGSSEVTFELFEEGTYTRLQLTHTGIGTFPRQPQFARERFENGWKQILGTNLKNHLAKAVG